MSSSADAVAPFDCFEFVGVQCGFAEDLQQHVGLALGVRVDIVRIALGEALLQIAVLSNDIRVCAQIIAHGQMIPESETGNRAHIEMMTGQRVRRAKGFPPVDPQVALMSISQNGKACDRRRHVGRRRDDDRDVDDWLCGKPWHRGAADVFDGPRDVGDSGPDRQPKLFERLRPARIVFDDDDPHVNASVDKNPSGAADFTREGALDVHLIDGTYELFRHYYGAPRARDAQGREVGAVRGVLTSILSMVNHGATHVGVATDHVIESFRNDLWPGYKTDEGIEPDLLAQFPLLEESLVAMGIAVWPMVEFEADDALAAAAEQLARSPDVGRIIICTPDKDLAQSVRGTRVVQLIRRTREIRDEAGVVKRFGVLPESIPDYLALVGDAADGYPGLPGWGAKSTAAVLSKFRHLEAIPDDANEWHVNASNAGRLARTLVDSRERVLLFRTLATLRTDIQLFDSVEDLRWKGPTPAFAMPASAATGSVLDG